MENFNTILPVVTTLYTIVFANTSGDFLFGLSGGLTGKIVVPASSTTDNFFIISNDKMLYGIYFYKLINTQSGKIYRGKFICE